MAYGFSLYHITVTALRRVEAHSAAVPFDASHQCIDHGAAAAHLGRVTACVSHLGRVAACCKGACNQCNALGRRLRFGGGVTFGVEAATVRGAGCNRTWCRLQPYVAAAAHRVVEARARPVEVTHSKGHRGAERPSGVEARQGKGLWCHGTWYVRHARGWYAYPVRTVRGASGQAALRPWCVQHAGGWHACPYVQYGGPGAYVSTQAKAK